MIQVKRGNIVDGQAIACAHGCNCQGVMGSGVAKALRDRYPNVFLPYRLAYEQGRFKLGSVINVWVNPDKVIFNMGTQEYYGYDKQQYASPDAIRECLCKVRTEMQNLNLRSLDIPPVGCGRGGLTKKVVYPIIAEIFEDSGINVTIWEY